MRTKKRNSKKTKNRNSKKTKNRKKINTKRIVNNKLLIIFDIDDTLIKSFFSNFISSYKNTEFIIAKNNKDYIIFLVRKYARFLLDYCFKYLNVGFWSNGKKNYVSSVLNKLLSKDQYKKTKFILSKNNIKNNNIEYIDILSKNKIVVPNINDNFIKPLDTLFNHNYFKNICKMNKTILIDDNLSHIAVNPNNSLLVPKFSYAENDNYLFQIFQWINENKNTKNVQKLSLKLFDFSEKITDNPIQKKYTTIKKDVSIGDFVKVKNNVLGYVLSIDKNTVNVIIYDDEPHTKISNMFNIIKTDKSKLTIYLL